MHITCEIWKGTDEANGGFVTYQLEADAGDMVLDALETIYHEFDPALSYRYACGIARCGECAMVVNGVPYLACEKKVEPFMRIEPLQRLPRIKDTVIDRRKVFDHIDRLLPQACDIEDMVRNLQMIDDATAKEDIENSIRLTNCYECMICQSMCPRYLEDGTDFPGPLGLLILMQMRENPAQKPFGKEWEAMLSASCLSCGKCMRYCPAEKKPLRLALELLDRSPKTAVRYFYDGNGEQHIQEVADYV